MSIPPRRGYTRHPIALKTEVRSAEGWIEAETVDISRMGLQLRTAPGIDSSPVLQLRIHLEPVPIVVQARITRRIGGVMSPGEVPGIGVELMSMQQDARRRWDEFVIETSRASAQMATVAPPPRGLRRASSVAVVDVVLPGGRRQSTPQPELSRPGGSPSTVIPGEVLSSRGPLRQLSGEGPVVPPGPSSPAAPPAAPPGPTSASPHTAPQQRPGFLAAPVVGSALGLASPLQHNEYTPKVNSGPMATPRLGSRPTAEVALPPAVSAVPSASATVLRVRPASPTRLAALVDRRLTTCDLFLRPDVELREGEEVSLVLVHHATDGELAMGCEVDRVLSGRPGSRPGVMLRFAAASAADDAAIRAFVLDGAPPALQPSAATMAQTDAGIESLRRATEERPEDARRWIRLGWALLIANRPGEATAPLQRGVTLAPTLAVGPMLLVLAHGLCGDLEGARTTLGGLGAAELLETMLD